MAASTKLLLEFRDDSKFHVVTEDATSIGEAYEIPDAIQQAREISNTPIDFGDSYEGFTRLMVPEKPENAIIDTETFISALAEIAGMKVTKNYNDDMIFMGWTMELIE